jgi:hypothetical protein
MQNIDPDLLANITGGYARANASNTDSATELAITKLASDIKGLAKPPPQNNQMTTMMMMMMVMRR